MLAIVKPHFVYTMGWGVCFGLDTNGRVYCVDGCNWRSTASDYADFPSWPSAAQSVLDYFEGEAHRELDMVRDECPGTAAALKVACDEHISTALSCYDGFSDEEKQRLHEEKMEQLTKELEDVKHRIASSENLHKFHKNIWTDFKKNGITSKRKACRTRADELEQEMRPFQLELNMEKAALECDSARKYKAQLVRLLNREKKFSLN